MTGPITQRHYVPALDGLRTFAVALVILVHVSSRVAPGGWVGVDVFFVLSGYLITSVLLREQAAKGDISFRDFYIRRVLRLMPALVLLVVGDGVLAALFGGPSPNKLLDAAAALTYLMDAEAFSHVSDLSTLGHTWSLAVEEHFYIVWPLVLVLVLRLRRSAQLPVIIAMAAAIVLWRAYLVHSGASYDRTDYPADARSDQMFIGCALAFWLSNDPRASVIAMLRRLWPIGLAIILTVTVYDVTYQPWFRSFGLVAIGLASATLIFWSSARTSKGCWPGPPRSSRWWPSNKKFPLLRHLSVALCLHHANPLPRQQQAARAGRRGGVGDGCGFVLPLCRAAVPEAQAAL